MRATRTRHVDGALAARYADGSLPDADARPVELHIESCSACAALVSAAVRAVPDAGPVLAEVRAALLTQASAVSRETPATAPVPAARPAAARAAAGTE
ncbi:zf-HC2 domain-containing protein, partial [Streptomyces sp. GC420]|uniref:zf-HC2 domain-containing protein n=1 Tax=Streptomyces sp. GC420 TaxID=2697568 RepID=UPI001AA17126